MSENIEIRLKKAHLKLVGLIALALAVIIVGTAIAAYLGPNRFGPETTCTTNCTGGECSYTGSMTSADSINFFCTLNLPAPNAGSCISANAAKGWYTEGACGWPDPDVDAWGTISSSFNGWSCTTTGTTCTTTTVALSPATVSSSTACTANGSNGWCVGTATLNISSNDPLAGYSIVAIEGEMDSVSPFTCGGSFCSPISVPEGSHSFEFWANSDYGDGSLKGSATVKVDTVNPSVSAGISGTAGSNGWYVSNVDVSGSASDGTSGLASLQVQTNGGGYGTYSTPITLTEGTHSVDFIATDNAGLTNGTSVNVSVDTIIPTVTLSSPGSITGIVSLSGNYADATSGVASVEVNPGGTGWTSVSFSGGNWSYTWDSTAVSNGNHTIQSRSIDTAGNVSTTASVNVTINNTLPFVSLPGSWVIWDSASIVVKEGALPLAGAQITISDAQGRWTARTISYNPAYANGFTWDRKFGDGTTAPIGDYTVTVKAWDTLGQTTTRFGTIMIPAPVSSASSTSTSDSSPLVEYPNPANFVLLNEINSGGGASKDPDPTSGSGQTVQTEPVPTLATATPGQVYWGPVAVGLASSATAYVMASKKKREEEEEQKRLEEARLRAAAYASRQQKRLKKASESALRKEFMAGGGRADAPIAEIQKVLQNAHTAAAVKAQEAWAEKKKQEREKAKRVKIIRSRSSSSSRARKWGVGAASTIALASILSNANQQNQTTLIDPPGYSSDCLKTVDIWAAQYTGETHKCDPYVKTKSEIVAEIEVTLSEDYGVSFDNKGDEDWDEDVKVAMAAGIFSTGNAFADNMDGVSNGGEAFRIVYDTSTDKPLVLTWNKECYDCRSTEKKNRCKDDFTPDEDKFKDCSAGGAVTKSQYDIRFATVAPDYYDNYFIRWRNHMVHELGHAFNAAVGGNPYVVMADALNPYSETYNPFLERGTEKKKQYGFAGDYQNVVWHQSREGTNYEIFADQFLGWVYGEWALNPDETLTDEGQARSDWMEDYMPGWLEGKQDA